jgi:hypothetical protein
MFIDGKPFWIQVTFLNGLNTLSLMFIVGGIAVAIRKFILAIAKTPRLKSSILTMIDECDIIKACHHPQKK